MVAYSFQRRFCADIVSGRKLQTIRSQRKRHARPGEALQLYFGMRTRACRKLIEPDPLCVSVEPIRIWVPEDSGCIALAAVSNSSELIPVSDVFALADGFSDASDFTEFWRANHGVGVFRGVLIGWTLLRAGIEV